MRQEMPELQEGNGQVIADADEADDYEAPLTDDDIE